MRSSDDRPVNTPQILLALCAVGIAWMDDETMKIGGKQRDDKGNIILVGSVCDLPACKHSVP
eukprot:scaffold600862_cov42-Prasinocladus_malaysianus.AAC.1